MNAALMAIHSSGSPRDRCAPAPRRGSAARVARLPRGFTLTELLVVIAIVGLLMALALVSMSKARTSTKRAATTALLSSIGAGIEQYHADIGAYPPLVTGLGDYGEEGENAIETPGVRGAVARINGGANARDAMRDEINQVNKDARFNSEWTLAAFLMGVGDLNGDMDIKQGWWEDENSDGEIDADDNFYDDGRPGPGIRHPGKSPGAWKSIEDGAVEQGPEQRGNTYGPYLEPADRFIERVPVVYDSSVNRIVVNRNVRVDSNPQFLFRFVDSWGNPIRYYKDWNYRDANRDVTPDSMGLAPIELRSYDDLNLEYESGEKSIDSVITGAPYALLAAGADPLLRMPAGVSGGVGDVVSPFGDRYLDNATNDPLYWQTTFDSEFEFGAKSVRDQQAILDYLKSNVRYAP